MQDQSSQIGQLAGGKRELVFPLILNIFFYILYENLILVQIER